MSFCLKRTFDAHFQLHICSSTVVEKFYIFHTLQSSLFIFYWELVQSLHSIHCLKQITFRQGSSDWLSLSNRRFEGRVGGNSVLTVRAMCLISYFAGLSVDKNEGIRC